MKILDFSPYYPPHIGGLEKYAEELHEQFIKKGHIVTVFTSRLPKNAKEREIKRGILIVRYPAFDIIYNYPLPCFWQPKFWRQWRSVRRENYDVVISTSRFFIQPLLAYFHAKIKKLPRLHIEHGSDFIKGTFFVSLVSRIFDYTVGRFVLLKASSIVAPSQSASLFVKKLTGRTSPVIYRGMPFSEVDSIQPDYNLKKSLNDKKIITFIGRLIYGKGVICLLEAVRKINRSDIIILIVGDGSEMKNLQRYVKDNLIKDTVLFLGNIPFENAIGILKISDIFINSSYNEGLPTSVLEAGVCRRAIIATNVGGTPEIITHNHSGILITPHSTRAIREAIKEIIDDVQRRDTLGRNAREEIEKRFNWNESAVSYLKELTSIIKK